MDDAGARSNNGVACGAAIFLVLAVATWRWVRRFLYDANLAVFEDLLSRLLAARLELECRLASERRDAKRVLLERRSEVRLAVRKLPFLVKEVRLCRASISRR